MKKLLGALLCCGLLLTGCGSSSDTESGAVNVNVGGSTSVQPLMELIAEQFNVDGLGTVSVQGGGSSAGAEGAIKGTFDLGMVSRDLKAEETKELKPVIICLDGIVLVVNKDNKVKDITLENIKKIYMGEINNWKELGGDDSEIAVVSREEGSGTRDGFQSVIGFDSEEQIANAAIQNATGAVVSSISGNKNAIGYISLGSLTDEVQSLSIDGVKASESTILDASYKVQRPFIVAVKKDSKVGKELIDYIFSEAGQKIIKEHKYIPVEVK